MMRTIVKFTRRKRERLFVTVYDDGHYQYQSWTNRRDRQAWENWRRDDGMKPLYRVNVFPKPALKGDSL